MGKNILTLEFFLFFVFLKEVTMLINWKETAQFNLVPLIFGWGWEGGGILTTNKNISNAIS